MKNKILTIISIIIAGGLIALATALPNAQEKEYKKLAEFEKEFMIGCTEDNQALSTFCTCVYNELEDKLGYDGLVKFALEYDATGVLPNGTDSVINSCLAFAK